MNAVKQILRRWRVIGVVAVATGLLGGCTPQEEPRPTQVPPRNVRTLSLEPQSFAEYFEVSGPLAPVRGTVLSAEEGGVVRDFPVRKGASVAAGDPVIALDRRILRAERSAAEQGLQTEKFNVEQVRLLQEAGKVSRFELLTAESTFAQAQAVADVAAERFSRAWVSAPFDGIMVERYVELGQLVNPGMPVARVIDPYVLKLEAYLTEREVGWVDVGDSAIVQLAGAGDPAPGTVSWVGFEADRLTGKFKIEVEVANPQLTWRSGVIGRARLNKNSRENVIAIPRDAVVAGRVGPTAFVVDNGRAVQKQLVLGEGQGLMVVVSSGLQFGQELVVRGQRELRDGSLVRVTETATRADGGVVSDPAAIGQSQADARLSASAEAKR